MLFLTEVMTADHTEEETFRWALKNGGILTGRGRGGFCRRVSAHMWETRNQSLCLRKVQVISFGHK